MADTEEDYKKLAEAVKGIDASWQEEERSFAIAQDDTTGGAQDDSCLDGAAGKEFTIRCVKDASAAMDIADAWEAEYEDIPPAAAEGRISAVSVSRASALE